MSDDHHHHHQPATQAEVYARRLELSLAGDYRIRLEGLLAAIAAGLSERHLPFLGHVKLAARDAGGSVFYASVVDATVGPQSQGELSRLDAPVELKLNAILYGVGQAAIRAIVEQELQRLDVKTL